MRFHKWVGRMKAGVDSIGCDAGILRLWTPSRTVLGPYRLPRPLEQSHIQGDGLLGKLGGEVA